MPQYRLSNGYDQDFFAQGAGEVVPILQERRKSGENEGSFIRRVALEMCEWNGKNYYYHSRDALAASMMRNGLLEVID